MRIGIPKEIKINENRVAVTPAGVAAFVKAGHQVVIETGAGLGSGISDADYSACGAVVQAKAADAWQAELVLKVKEPLEEEYQYLRPDLTLFTYLHLAPEPHLTRAMMQSGMTGIGYETVQLASGSLPLLEPMSEVAGKMAIQIGAHFLARHPDTGPLGAPGSGVLLGGVPGVPAGHVVIIGSGIVGTNAAKVAVGMGARVTLFDIKMDRLRYLDDIFGGRVGTTAANAHTIGEAVRTADLVVGAVLIPGGRTPVLVSEDMVKTMRPGSVMIDVAIDQGGCIETMNQVTSHADPVFIRHSVIHYAVPNMPGAVPRTSTFALTNATLPYALKLAALGWEAACRENPALAKGVNITCGKCTHRGVAEAQNIEYTPLDRVLL